MKKIVSILCIIVMLASVLSLSACGSNSGSNSGTDVSGSYKLIEMVVGGESMNEYLELVGDVILEVNGNKATLTMGEDVTELTVDTNAMTFTASGSASHFTVDGNTLTMEEKSAGTKMVFEKQK